MDSLPRTPNWRRYLRFWRADVAADVDEELRFHLESRADELVGQGQSPEAATAQALSEMGDLPAVRAGLQAIDRRVLSRQSIAERWRRVGSEIGRAVRRLRQSLLFTTAAMLTLTIAIGATASVFGLVDGVLLKAFPYRDPDRVLTIGETMAQGQRLGFPPVTSPANYLDWRTQVRTFSSLTATRPHQFAATGTQEPERLSGLLVTPSYFAVLGITPVLGRPLAVDSAGPAEVVISYDYWQTRFGGMPTALGQSLALNDSPYTVVGVMPAGLAGDVELWTRLSFTGADQTNRRMRTLWVYGRLKPGATADGAQREMTTIGERLGHAYPDVDKKWSVVTHPLLDQLVGQVRPALVALLVAAGCVLLIGAANLANLFLVRCAAREGEMAVRTALGATRSRLVAELLLEATALGLAAAALGVGAAVAGVRVLRALAPTSLPRLSQIGVDVHVVAFCALTSLTTVFLFGVLPAWQTSRGNLADFLKEGGRGTDSPEHYRLQNGLVVLQVVVALILLTGAGLLGKSFAHFLRLDLGVQPERVLTARINLPTARYATPDRQAAFFANVVDRIAARPGVDAAGASLVLPGERMYRGFLVLGEPSPDSIWPTAFVNAVTPDYFRTMGIKLLRGRGLLPADDRRGREVAVIDEPLARQFFASRDPIGQRLTLGGPDTMEIVGVVTAVKQGGLLDTLNLPEIYASFAQSPLPFGSIAVRTSGDPLAQMRALKEAVFSVDRTVPASDVQTLGERLDQSVDMIRFSTFLASLFALVALALGIVGIYSVLTYVVSRRRREIAVRMALGARPSRVMASVLSHACFLAGTGIVIGSAAAWILARVLARLFLGVSPHDPGIFVGAAATFAVVALAAASVPAFRTTRVNPVVALTAT
jgi:putative ABC transport system permease protein